MLAVCTDSSRVALSISTCHGGASCVGQELRERFEPRQELLHLAVKKLRGVAAAMRRRASASEVSLFFRLT